jgi:hypothetical protein
VGAELELNPIGNFLQGNEILPEYETDQADFHGLL